MIEICIASNNAHKLKEIKEILGESYQLLSLSDIGCTDDIPETQPTIEGNSLQKAQYIWDHYKINCLELFLQGMPVTTEAGMTILPCC